MQIPKNSEFDILLRAASGEAAALSEALSHTDGRRKVAHLRGFLAAVSEELLDMRADCPTPDELAELPPGAEHSDPHLRDCQLCREEVRMLFELESERRLGVGPGAGGFYRPQPLQTGAAQVIYQGDGKPPEMDLQDGENLDVRLEAALVRIQCEDGELIVSVDGEITGSPMLVLNDALLEKRLALTAAGLRLPVQSWRKVRLEVEPKGSK